MTSTSIWTAGSSVISASTTAVVHGPTSNVVATEDDTVAIVVGSILGGLCMLAFLLVIALIALLRKPRQIDAGYLHVMLQVFLYAIAIEYFHCL